MHFVAQEPNLAWILGSPLSEKQVSHDKNPKWQQFVKMAALNCYKNTLCLFGQVSTIWVVHAQNAVFKMRGT